MRSRLAAPLTAAVLALAAAGCTDDSRSPADAPAAGDVPKPVATIPSYVSELSQTVGEYVVTPGGGHDLDDAKAVAEKLRGTPGVQSAEVRDDGALHVEIHPSATAQDRERVLRQLAALGAVQEGI